MRQGTFRSRNERSRCRPTQENSLLVQDSSYLNTSPGTRKPRYPPSRKRSRSSVGSAGCFAISSRLRKTRQMRTYGWNGPHGASVGISSGCSKSQSSKAASEEARRTLRYVEPLNDVVGGLFQHPVRAVLRTFDSVAFWRRRSNCPVLSAQDQWRASWRFSEYLPVSNGQFG